jgi:hypothetical protein
MYKRKIMGILKYGTEDTHPQNTGFSRRRDCSCFKAYDWRDDPYELMLLQQRLHKLLGIRASGRKAASSSSGIKKSILF